MKHLTLRVLSIVVLLFMLAACASDQAAIHLTALDPQTGIVLLRRHDVPDRLAWTPSAQLRLGGDLHLTDERGRIVPGVTIPRNFQAIRIDSAGRVYASDGRGPARVVGRVIVVGQSEFDAIVRAHPNPLDALEEFWRTEPEDARLLHVGTPAN